MTRGQWRTLMAGVVLTGWAIGQAALAVPGATATGTLPIAPEVTTGTAPPATPTAMTSAQAANPIVVPAPITTSTIVMRGDGHDAPWLRFGVIGLLGLALGGGVVVQYRGTTDAPPHQPKPRRPRRLPQQWADPATIAVALVAAAPVPPAPDHPTPVFSAFTRQPQASMPGTSAPSRPTLLRMTESTPRLTPAEEHGAHAIAAAFRYDRRATLAAFMDALDLDPTLKPSLLSDFWEMPAGGHADLATAYLKRAQPLDARSVVALALLTFPHNRELTTLLREIDPYRFGQSA